MERYIWQLQHLHMLALLAAWVLGRMVVSALTTKALSLLLQEQQRETARCHRLCCVHTRTGLELAVPLLVKCASSWGRAMLPVTVRCVQAGVRQMVKVASLQQRHLACSLMLYDYNQGRRQRSVLCSVARGLLQMMLVMMAVVIRTETMQRHCRHSAWALSLTRLRHPHLMQHLPPLQAAQALPLALRLRQLLALSILLGRFPQPLLRSVPQALALRCGTIRSLLAVLQGRRRRWEGSCPALVLAAVLEPVLATSVRTAA